MTHSSCNVPRGWVAQGQLTETEDLCSQCGYKQIFGGYEVLGANSKIIRTYSEVAPHNRLRVSFNFWKIDGLNNKNFNLLLNGVFIVENINHILG